MAFTPLTHGQSSSTDGNGFTSSSIDTTGATLLVVAVADSNAAAAGTLSDSKSNTWTQILSIGSGGGTRATLYYSKPTIGVGPGHTFSITGAANVPTLSYVCYAGGSPTVPLDQSSDAGGGGISTIQPGSITPSRDNALVVCMLSANTTVITPSIDSGFTLLNAKLSDGVNFEGAGLAYKIQTTPAAVNPTWTADNCTLTTVIANFLPLRSSMLAVF